MLSGLMFGRRSIPFAILACSLMTAPLAGQATNDSPTLLLGIFMGATQGADFWHVPNQPIVAPPRSSGEPLYDIFDIHRKLTGNLTFGLQATVFKSPHLGFSAEVSYLGLGTKDHCTLATSTGYQQNSDACTSLNRSDRSSSAGNFWAGVVVRPWDRTRVQPYFLGRAGVSAVSDNLVSLTARPGIVIPIYPSNGGLSIRPSGAVGFGLSTNFGAGYAFRLEARESWLQLTTVTGPSEHDEIAPPTGSVFKRMGSLLLGFDVILEKSRGRRY